MERRRDGETERWRDGEIERQRDTYTYTDRNPSWLLRQKRKKEGKIGFIFVSKIEMELSRKKVLIEY